MTEINRTDIKTSVRICRLWKILVPVLPKKTCGKKWNIWA